MWATRYRRLRDGFRVLQARLAKTVRESHLAPTQTQKGELVSPPESSLLLLANELVRFFVLFFCFCFFCRGIGLVEVVHASFGYRVLLWLSWVFLHFQCAMRAVVRVVWVVLWCAVRCV